MKQTIQDMKNCPSIFPQISTIQLSKDHPFPRDASYQSIMSKAKQSDVEQSKARTKYGQVSRARSDEVAEKAWLGACWGDSF